MEANRKEEGSEIESAEEQREMLEDEAYLSMNDRYNKTRNLYTQVCDECGYRIKGLGVNDKEEKVSLHTHCIVKQED